MRILYSKATRNKIMRSISNNQENENNGSSGVKILDANIIDMSLNIVSFRSNHYGRTEDQIGYHVYIHLRNKSSSSEILNVRIWLKDEDGKDNYTYAYISNFINDTKKYEEISIRTGVHPSPETASCEDLFKAIMSFAIKYGSISNYISAFKSVYESGLIDGKKEIQTGFRKLMDVSSHSGCYDDNF